MISQQTKKELSYLWNQAKDLFSFNETFVELTNPNLNAPENKKYLEIIKAFKWGSNEGRSIIRTADDPDYIRPDYGDKITKGIYTPGEIIRARLAFNAARAAVRYFDTLACQDKFSTQAFFNFCALEDIHIPGSTFDVANTAIDLAEPFLSREDVNNNPAAVNINEVFETANKVASCRYPFGEFVLNREDIIGRKTYSFSKYDAVDLLDRADRKEGEFDLTVRYPDDNRKIDEALHAVDEYCIRDTFLKTAIREAGYAEIPFDDLKDAITLAAPELMKINESKDILESNRLSYENTLVENKKEGYIWAVNSAVEDSLGMDASNPTDVSEINIRTVLSDGQSYALAGMKRTTDRFGRENAEMDFIGCESGELRTFRATDFRATDLRILSEQIDGRIAKAKTHRIEEQISTGPFGLNMRLLKDRADLTAAVHKYNNLPALRRVFSSRPEEREGAPTTAQLMNDCAITANTTFLKDAVVSDDDGTMMLTIFPADQPLDHDKEDLLRIQAIYVDMHSGRSLKTVHEIPLTPDGRLTFESHWSGWAKDYRKDTPAMEFYNTMVDNLRRFVEGGCVSIISEKNTNEPLILSTPETPKESAAVEIKETDSLTPTPGGYILNTGNGFRLLDRNRHDTLDGITVDAFSQIQNNVSVARIGEQHVLVDLKTNKPLGGKLRLFSYAGEMTPDGLALVRMDSSTGRDGRYNYLKQDGTLLSKDGYETALPFKDGKASVTRGGRNFVIDTKGVVVEAEQVKSQQTLNKGIKV